MKTCQTAEKLGQDKISNGGMPEVSISKCLVIKKYSKKLHSRMLPKKPPIPFYLLLEK